jgi:hypothetical protein
MTHLTPQQLSARLDEALQGVEHRSVEWHLSECEPCRDALAALTMQDNVLADVLRGETDDDLFRLIALQVERTIHPQKARKLHHEIEKLERQHVESRRLAEEQAWREAQARRSAGLDRDAMGSLMRPDDPAAPASDDSAEAAAANGDPARAEAPKVEAPRIETPKVEAPRVEAPKREKSRFEAPEAEAPRIEKPRAEFPRITPARAEAAKTDAPTPKPEAPAEPRETEDEIRAREERKAREEAERRALDEMADKVRAEAESRRRAEELRVRAEAEARARAHAEAVAAASRMRERELAEARERADRENEERARAESEARVALATAKAEAEALALKARAASDAWLEADMRARVAAEVAHEREGAPAPRNGSRKRGRTLEWTIAGLILLLGANVWFAWQNGLLAKLTHRFGMTTVTASNPPVTPAPSSVSPAVATPPANAGHEAVKPLPDSRTPPDSKPLRDSKPAASASRPSAHVPASAATAPAPVSPAPAAASRRRATSEPKAAAEDSDAPTGVGLVCGTVRDENARPIAGARVAMIDVGAMVVTDGVGRFCFTVSSGDHVMAVLARGHVPTRQKVSVGSQTTELVLTLRSSTSGAGDTTAR